MNCPTPVIAFGLLVLTMLPAPAQETGIFSTGQDIGKVKLPGSSSYDASTNSYTVSGGGTNMWMAVDVFHFRWSKISGDATLAAGISLPAATRDPHAKAVLIIRQSLDADSAYADAALHADGLTSLQYRETKGARTYEIQANISNPQRLRLEKRGKYLSLSLAGEGGELLPAGGSSAWS